MKKALLLSLLVSSYLIAGNLVVTHGTVKAHTEVFGDSQINPTTTKLTSHLSMSGDPTTLTGSIDVSMKGLKSDNEDRDEHMSEAINSGQFPNATYTISSVTKSGGGYKLDGKLSFHGTTKPLTLHADISKSGDKVSFKGNGTFAMSSFGVTPPKLLLLTVRDRIDLTIDVNFNNQ